MTARVNRAVDVQDLGAAALDHILAGRRAVLAAAAVRDSQPVLVDLLLRRGIALAGADFLRS